MVRTVDLYVTSHAATTDDSRIAVGSDPPRSQIFGRLEGDGMVSNAKLRVALLTQEGRRRDQQTVLI